MEMVQIEVKNHQRFSDGAITHQSVVWVDASWKLKKGQIVKFISDDRKWEVTEVYKQRIQTVELDKKWGLNLPKSQRTER